ncbi:hypothetical protein Ct9H90mP12_2860 [bacterium]|nr:MAG: hypothetical protein Ct9H90mP12_2860 [bacterium]
MIRPHLLLLDRVKKSGSGARITFEILLLAIGGAILSWVMPCVYPMIPIIISFFGKMSEDKNIGRTTIATFYGLGIAVPLSSLVYWWDFYLGELMMPLLNQNMPT